jgi:hypothetical protein
MKCGSRYVVLVVIILLVSPAALAPTYAQQGGQVQELSGKVEQGRFQFYLLPDLKQGQILYVYASGTSGNLDPIAGLIDTNCDFQAAAAEYDAELEQIIAEGRDPLLAADELRDRFLLVWDDDSGGGLAAAFQFRVPRDGDYRLALTGSLSYQVEDTFGHYRLLLGLIAPEVLTGEVELSGDVIAVPDEAASQIDVGVESLTGALNAEKPSTFVRLRDFEAGDTLYAFAEATSGDLKPVLVLRNFARKPIRTANLDWIYPFAYIIPLGIAVWIFF